MSNSGKIIVYNKQLDLEKMIYPDELDKYLLKGYVKGRKPFSDEHKKKIGQSNKGKKSPLKDVPRTEEVKKKISKTKTGKKHSEERKLINSKAQSQCRWYNNGKREKRCFPRNKPKGWVSGRLPMSEEQKQKCSNSHIGKKLTESQLEIRASKEYLTKKKNNSFNTSKPEEELYKSLLAQYNEKTILRRYKEERYPFYCDFYIVEDDLFIELNAHWTHGGKPYDPEDKECQEKLKLWQEKAKQSKFYENAIKTWTERDVKKQQIAKQNHLNYKVIY